LVACAFSALSHQHNEEHVKIKDIIKESEFLVKLLDYEFINKPSPRIKEDFSGVVDYLIQRDVFTTHETYPETVSVPHEGAGYHTFLCNMFWPLIDSCKRKFDMI